MHDGVIVKAEKWSNKMRTKFSTKHVLRNESALFTS